MAKKPRDLPVIGWREWPSLPQLGVDAIKVKVDTGARSSAIHAWDVEEFEKDGATWVRFLLHPRQRETKTTVRAEAPLLEHRKIRSSTGHEQKRPVIETDLCLLDECWPIELTLTTRDNMGFRMLLGRQAVRGRYLVDPGRSYMGGRPDWAQPKKRRKKKPRIG